MAIETIVWSMKVIETAQIIAISASFLFVPLLVSLIAAHDALAPGSTRREGGAARALPAELVTMSLVQTDGRAP